MAGWLLAGSVGEYGQYRAWMGAGEVESIRLDPVRTTPGDRPPTARPVEHHAIPAGQYPVLLNPRERDVGICGTEPNPFSHNLPGYRCERRIRSLLQPREVAGSLDCEVAWRLR
jgi:hypothetical protein